MDFSDREPLLQSTFQASEIGIDHQVIARSGEDEGDIDADALICEFLYRCQSFVSGRDFDQYVWPVHFLPEREPFLDRRRSFSR